MGIWEEGRGEREGREGESGKRSESRKHDSRRKGSGTRGERIFDCTSRNEGKMITEEGLRLLFDVCLWEQKQQERREGGGVKGGVKERRSY